MDLPGGLAADDPVKVLARQPANQTKRRRRASLLESFLTRELPGPSRPPQMRIVARPPQLRGAGGGTKLRRTFDEMICPTSYLRQELVNAPPISCRERKIRQSHDPVIAQGSQGQGACRSSGFDRRYGPGLQGGRSCFGGQRRRKAVGRRDGFQRGFGKALLPSSPQVGGQISAPPFGNLAWLRAFLCALWALSQGRRKPPAAQASCSPSPPATNGSAKFFVPHWRRLHGASKA